MKIAGIITAKKTKTLKNGDTMAFITVEDRASEIEVIIFAKQYSRFVSEIYLENAVVISGKLTYDDTDEAKVILSSVSSLESNTTFAQNEKKREMAAKQPERVFIKLQRFDEGKLTPIYRMSSLNPGKCAVVIYDASTSKYVAMKGITISSEQKVIDRLKALFGNDNVVVK